MKKGLVLKKITLKMVAEKAGCSIAVVSKVLNHTKGSIGVGDKVRARVLEVAAELGYRANYHATALKTGKSNTVGLLFPTSSHTSYWGQYLGGVDRAVRAAGKDLLVIGAHDESGSEVEQGSRELLEQRVDALVVTAPFYYESMEALLKIRAPIACLGIYTPKGLPSVLVDMEPGLAQAVAHLAEFGHKEILWVCGRLNGERTDRGRGGIVRTHAEKLNMQVTDFVVDMSDDPGLLESEEEIRAPRAAIQDYLKSKKPPTAIMAYNERFAIGAMQALNEANYSIPKDVSIVGIDNILSTTVYPEMTSIDLAAEQCGRRAAEIAIMLSDKPALIDEYRDYREPVASFLVKRASTGPAPRK